MIERTVTKRCNDDINRRKLVVELFRGRCEADENKRNTCLRHLAAIKEIGNIFFLFLFLAFSQISKKKS